MREEGGREGAPDAETERNGAGAMKTKPAEWREGWSRGWQAGAGLEGRRRQLPKKAELARPSTTATTCTPRVVVSLPPSFPTARSSASDSSLPSFHPPLRCPPHPPPPSQSSSPGSVILSRGCEVAGTKNFAFIMMLLAGYFALSRIRSPKLTVRRRTLLLTHTLMGSAK